LLQQNYNVQQDLFCKLEFVFSFQKGVIYDLTASTGSHYSSPSFEGFVRCRFILFGITASGFKVLFGV
jgi:hypothetical protein